MAEGVAEGVGEAVSLATLPLVTLRSASAVLSSC